MYHEQLFGTIGFDGMSSLLYHTHPPTGVKEILNSYDVSPKIAVSKNMKSIRLDGFKAVPHDDYLESRKRTLLQGEIDKLKTLRG